MFGNNNAAQQLQQQQQRRQTVSGLLMTTMVIVSIVISSHAATDRATTVSMPRTTMATAAAGVAEAAAAAATTIPKAVTATTPKTRRHTTTPATRRADGFVPHRFKSNNNITILHEVQEAEHASRTAQEEDVVPLVLNTHEVLPLKPVKKKPYEPFEKTPLGIYAQQRPLKEYDLHPVTFDFNLGDLEDLEEHESIKKGDLSTEQRHLLQNTSDVGLSYTERTKLDVEIEELLENAATPSVFVGSSIEATDYLATTTTTTTIIVPTTTTPTTTTSTVGTYILKIMKNKPEKKGRELLKSDDQQSGKGLGSNFNSINRYLGGSGAALSVNATAESLYATANYFQVLTNLYDHFYWQASEIRNKVRTGCGLEIQAYLTALRANYEWAQRAYDVSGRYRGQVFFGNDKWLGQLSFCAELNNQDSRVEGERHHFEFQFFVADIALNLHLPNKLQLVLSIGECLPKSCSSQDVQAILTLDPHALMLATETDAINATLNATTKSSPALQILQVRIVPGPYSLWRELKFQIFISFLLTLLLVVLIASCYQMKLDDRQLATLAPITAISAKIDAGQLTQTTEPYYGKPYELFQMRILGDASNGQARGNSNNETVADTDVNGNKDFGTSAESKGEATTVSNEAHAAHVDVEKSELPHYKAETNSCHDGIATYEAQPQQGLHGQILLCFAFQTNARAILDIDKVKEAHTRCLHGLRVISLLWTIMVHTYLQMFAVGENKFQRKIVERSFLYQIVGNATFSVDTFFFISGLLVTLLYLKQNHKVSADTRQFVRSSCYETFIMLLYRYIRLTPAYLFTILTNDFSVRQGLDSSVFKPGLIEYNGCRQYWWRNILYINNFFPMHGSCMLWSWYMANDMQFFIMASLLLAFSRKYFKFVVLTLVSFLLSSWAVSGLVSLQHHYTHKVALPFESLDFLYDKPWQRVGAYIIGMSIGYVLHKVKSPPKIAPRTNRLLWAGSLGLLALVVFGAWNGELSLVSTAFYVGVGHSAFAVALIWIVLSCCWGLAPNANRLLSCRLFCPLSRLTYCTYLVHPIVMFILSTSMNGTAHLTNLYILTMFLGNAVISFCVAFIVSTLFEAPVIRVLKICLKK